MLKCCFQKQYWLYFFRELVSTNLKVIMEEDNQATYHKGEKIAIISYDSIS